MRLLSLYDASSAFATCALAGFPSQPEDAITKQIPGRPGVSISYKETTICETRAKGYAGYVHLPASGLADVEPAVSYNASMFFWYFEARQHPRKAPTAIYLAGGPGQSSMVGATQSGGPCTILPDANSTEDNPFSWNDRVNMLYVDQPVGAGFSYDTLLESMQDLLFLGSDNPTDSGIYTIESYNESAPAENTTLLYGTFPSQDPYKSANNTNFAARTLWHFSQVWFSEFPEYKTEDKSISFWGNSYGGYWVPTSAEYFLRQNEKIKNGDLKDSHILEVSTIGWTNGCTDLLYQAEWYPEFAYNNTYGIEVIPEKVYLEAKHNYTKEGGCRDQIIQCREFGDLYDPDHLATNETVNKLCVAAIGYCAIYVIGAYDILSNRSDFDMTHMKPEPFPTAYLDGFFNREWVQKELGVPLNFTAASNIANYNFFYASGDAVRAAGMKSIEYLLNSGVKAALIYGDRDYRCPWNGAEQLSLQADWIGADEFRSAGYEYIKTGDCNNGGVVRQYGNFSFSRVFQAGHDVAAYQPHAAFEIFNRAMFDKDVATGEKSISGSSNDYSTKGPASSFHIKNDVPKVPEVNCNIYAVGSSCTIEQYTAIVDGSAVIDNFTVVEPVGGSPGALVNFLTG